MKTTSWRIALKNFEKPRLSKSLGQFLLTLFSYLFLLSSMILILKMGLPYWIALIIAIPTAGFQVKLFIIMHDCGHQSYFKSKRANNAVGRLTALLTFTPYYSWRHDHAIHHATVSNLEKRGIGDIWTMTVEEYKKTGPWKRFFYRLFRNPLFLFTIAPVFQFLIGFRFPQRKAGKKDNLSILFTDMSLAAVILAMHFTLGLGIYLMTILPVMALASSFGVWLFYVQHQFEDVYWDHDTQWDLEKAALDGSSYYKLPGILRWFSGNIGYHHIHHLNSHIPNYYLKKCHEKITELQQITPMNVRISLKSLFLNVWDEASGKMLHTRNI